MRQDSEAAFQSNLSWRNHSAGSAWGQRSRLAPAGCVSVLCGGGCISSSGEQQPNVTHPHLVVYAEKDAQSGAELWLPYGRTYWRLKELHTHTLPPVVDTERDAAGGAAARRGPAFSPSPETAHGVLATLCAHIAASAVVDLLPVEAADLARSRSTHSLFLRIASRAAAARATARAAPLCRLLSAARGRGRLQPARSAWCAGRTDWRWTACASRGRRARCRRQVANRRASPPESRK